MIGLLALIFWQFVPKPEVQVIYQPWFMDQVQHDNVKSLSIQGNELKGELRKETPYTPSPGSSTQVLVKKFYTYIPSEELIAPLCERLTRNGENSPEVVRIEGNPQNQATGLAWIILLLPTFVILGLIWLMMRRARINSMAGFSAAS